MFFSHRASFQIYFMGVVNQAVEDGIGDGRIPDMFMPVLDRQLTGDDGRCVSVSVFNDLQKVSSF